MSRQGQVHRVTSENGAGEAEALTRLEQLAVRGLIARDQQIHRELVVPLQEDWQAVVVDVARRIGFDPDRFGTEYQINVDTMTVDRLAMPEPEPVAAPEPSS